MQNVQAILSGRPVATATTRHPVIWSEAKCAALRRTAIGEIPGFSSIDAALSQFLLQCSEGIFDEAENGILSILHSNIEECGKNQEIFISLLTATFIVQRLDLTEALLRDRYGFPRPLQLAIEEGTAGTGGVHWHISTSGEHRFVFDAATLRDDNTRLEILAFQWEFPLLAHYAAQRDQESGSVFLSRTDVGSRPGLAYCDNRPDYFLIPDCIFVPTNGYAYARQILQERAPRWQDRTPVAFWRGASTGVPPNEGRWRELERIKLCEIARKHASSGLIDAGLSSIVQFGDPAVVQEIRDSGLVRGPVPWQDWGSFRYLIDIDGNSSPWSNLFQRLLTGSTVLKVESSRGLQQWFYDDLIPWENYVPIAPDMSDLMEKVRWLNRHDEFARQVGANGSELASRMTYERELTRSTAVISAAFRYFQGDYGNVAPYGRVSGRNSEPAY